jgi:hypothetical protein
MRDGEAFTLPLRLFHVRMFLPRLILCSRCPWMIDFCALFFPVTLSPCSLAPCIVYTVQISIPARSFSALLFRARILLARFFPAHMIPALLLHFFLSHHDTTFPSYHKVLTYVEYRAVPGVFQNIDPPTPSPPSEGQYFGRRQTLDWPLSV